MDANAWSHHIEHFKELLRVPVGDGETGVRRERRVDIESLHGVLSKLLFESYNDWPDQDDAWLLRNMAQVLTQEQDAALLSLLGAGDDQLFLNYIAGTCVSAWQTAAADGTASVQAADGASEQYTGTENSTNWAVSRTPGTYYYAFDGAEYRYSDRKQAVGSEWEPLPVRERNAANLAQPWGDAGGWCTPVHDAALYGDTHVYAVDREGPWLSRDEALRQLATRGSADTRADGGADRQEPAATRPTAWGTVWTNFENGAWVFGLTEQGPWTYTDGEAAVHDKEVLDQTMAQLATLLPDEDQKTLRKLAIQQVIETAEPGDD